MVNMGMMCPHPFRCTSHKRKKTRQFRASRVANGKVDAKDHAAIWSSTDCISSTRLSGQQFIVSKGASASAALSQSTRASWWLFRNLRSALFS